MDAQAWAEWKVEDLEKLLELVKEVVANPSMYGPEFLHNDIIPDIKETSDALISALEEIK